MVRHLTAIVPQRIHRLIATPAKQEAPKPQQVDLRIPIFQFQEKTTIQEGHQGAATSCRHAPPVGARGVPSD